ncbi:hypothetical protein [Microbacterium sp. MTN4-26]|uniref:hypothetical protein n=1 Tax=unclassified Microbacterium TaxID=2609290 RepID=UPI0036F23DF5
MWPVPLIVAFIVLGGLLPVIGVVRLGKHAHAALRTRDGRRMVDLVDEGTRTGYFDVEPIRRMAVALDEEPRISWHQACWDLALIGGGVLFGTAGSVWAVFI